MITVRASSLPLAISCSQSLDTSGLRIGGNREPADLGSAAHALLAAHITGDFAIEAADIAAEFDVDLEELEKLAAWGWSAFRSLDKWFPLPEVEKELAWTDEENGVRLTGRLDVLQSPIDGRIFVEDHKSGRLDSDSKDQIRAYCFLGLKHFPEADSAYGGIIRIRDQVTDGWVWTRRQLNAWWAGAVRKLKDQTFRPSYQACGHCPRGATCPAKTEILTQAAEFLIDRAQSWELPETERNQFVGDLYRRYKFVAKTIEDLAAMVKAFVVEQGGAIPIGNDQQLEIRKENHRHIDFPQAWGTLESALGKTSLMRLLEISRKKLDAAVGEKAAYRQKTKAIKALMDQLTADGAITTKTVEKLEIKRCENVIGSNSTTEPAAIGSDSDA